MKHTRRPGFPKAACSEVHSTWNHVFLFFFLEFPLLAQSSHPFVVTDWINLKPSPIHMARPRCWRLSWWELMLSCSMDGKKQEKKAPGTGFLRPLWIPLFQRCFRKSFCRFLKQFFGLFFCLSLKSCYWMIQRLMQLQLQLGCLWIQICGCEAASRGHRPTAGHLSGPPFDRPDTVWWTPAAPQSQSKN